MKFAYYYLNDQIKKYKAAQSEEEKNKISKEFFDKDVELFLEEIRRHL